MRSPPACASWILPRHTHTHTIVSTDGVKGDKKGQYFQTEYVISNRCGGKKMVMNKERCAAEKGAQAARSGAAGGETRCCYRALLNRRGKMATTSLLHPMSPVRYGEQRGLRRQTALPQGAGGGGMSPLPCHCPHRCLVSSGASQSPAQRCSGPSSP